jgi:hypothetical protein
MPSVATWWCGEQAALEFTIEHLDELVIKGSYPSQRFDPIFGNELTGSKREEMIARLRARPQAYVAQELVNFSQAPAWSTTMSGACCRAASACASLSPPPRRPRGDAGRPDARLCRSNARSHLDAARRLEQGHLGVDRSGGQYLQPAQALGRQGRPGARRPQPVLASGRKPVLVRPLRRTL